MNSYWWLPGSTLSDSCVGSSSAGAFTGGFHFQVNDGVNFAPRQIFSTTAFSLVLTLQKNHPIEVYPGTAGHMQGGRGGGGGGGLKVSRSTAKTVRKLINKLILFKLWFTDH